MDSQIRKLLVVALVVFSSIAMMGCRGECVTCLGKPSAVAPTSGCEYKVTSQERLHSNQGGNGGWSVNTNPPTTCQWRAVSNDPSWITITSGHSGTGNGEGNFKVGPNSGGGRQGSITVFAVPSNTVIKNITVTQNPR